MQFTLSINGLKLFAFFLTNTCCRTLFHAHTNPVVCHLLLLAFSPLFISILLAALLLPSPLTLT